MSVYEKAAEERRNIPRWKKELAEELTKPKLIRFPRRRVYSPNVDRIWTADLLDIQKYKRQNKGYTFILVVLDIFSRYAWVRPLKKKTGVEVSNAFQDIFRVSGRKCMRLWCDRGTEFYNRVVQELLTSNSITLYSTHNEPKATIAERFIRTLRSKIEKYFIFTHSTVWYAVLPDLVSEYNATKHRALGMSPDDALKPENYAKVFSRQYAVLGYNEKRNKARVRKYELLKVGDSVRISVHKGVFDKGSNANWSEEVFEIITVLDDRNPMLYKIQDLAGEEVTGYMYREQLQKTTQSVYMIDKVIRKRRSATSGKQEALVRWRGYPDKFNSWIPVTDVLIGGTAADDI